MTCETFPEKVSKILTQIGASAIKEMGKPRKALREEIHQRLKTGRSYTLDPSLKFKPST